VVEEMTEWCNRPLDPVYPVIFIDAIVVKVRDGQVRNKPIYVVVGVTVHGERDILGLWAGGGGEGAKFWLQVLTELKNRGVQDVCIAVCDGLKGLPDAMTTVWELAVVQACILHLIRNTFRFASRKYWDQIAHDLRPVYTAASEAEALARFEEFEEKWGKPYPAISRLWRSAWSEFVPFFDYDVEIRKISCSTNAIESINARYRCAIRARGHFPSDQAALKCLYLVTRSLDPTGKGKGTMGDEVEASTQRVRHHLRRPDPPGRMNQSMDQIRSTVHLTDPKNCGKSTCWHGSSSQSFRVEQAAGQFVFHRSRYLAVDWGITLFGYSS
jgi:putative transposase